MMTKWLGTKFDLVNILVFSLIPYIMNIIWPLHSHIPWGAVGSHCVVFWTTCTFLPRFAVFASCLRTLTTFPRLSVCVLLYRGFLLSYSTTTLEIKYLVHIKTCTMKSALRYWFANLFQRGRWQENCVYTLLALPLVLFTKVEKYDRNDQSFFLVS